jgi:hypothetical protein
MFNALKLEKELSRQGIPLFATDEPADIEGVNATTVLVRRVKQTVAEWYRLQLKEKIWKGLIEHSLDGWNVGTPAYGYTAERIPHPVPVKAAQGRTKSRLILDPARAPVIGQIYTWRTVDKLGCPAIAARLNADPAAYPPLNAATGWTAQNVRVIPAAADTSLLDRLPLAGDVLPRLSPTLKARLFQVFDITVLWNKAARQATVTAEITEATLQALDAILDPGQDGYHDTENDQPEPVGHLANTPRSSRESHSPVGRARSDAPPVAHVSQVPWRERTGAVATQVNGLGGARLRKLPPGCRAASRAAGRSCRRG